MADERVSMSMRFRTSADNRNRFRSLAMAQDLQVQDFLETMALAWIYAEDSTRNQLAEEIKTNGVDNAGWTVADLLNQYGQTHYSQDGTWEG